MEQSKIGVDMIGQVLWQFQTEINLLLAGLHLQRTRHLFQYIQHRNGFNLQVHTQFYPSEIQ